MHEFYLISGAILNRYREPILMNGASVDFARNMLERARTVNHLKDKLELENLVRQRAIWYPLNTNLLQDFPILNINYLTELTVGIYQIELALAYIQDSMQEMKITNFM